MITKKVPRRMWCYGLRYIVKLSQFIPQRADGRTGYEVVTGRTPDISEYCDLRSGTWCGTTRVPQPI
jgi:hypothetical protein